MLTENDGCNGVVGEEKGGGERAPECGAEGSCLQLLQTFSPLSREPDELQ